MPNQSRARLSLTKSDLFNCIQLIKAPGFNSAPIRRSGVSQCTPAFLTLSSAGQQCTSEKRKAEDAVEGPKMQGYWKERILFRVSCLERCVTENIRNVCRNASKCLLVGESAFLPRCPYCGRCLPMEVDHHMVVHCRRFDGTSRAAVTLHCHGSARQHRFSPRRGPRLTLDCGRSIAASVCQGRHGTLTGRRLRGDSDPDPKSCEPIPCSVHHGGPAKEFEPPCSLPRGR